MTTPCTLVWLRNDLRTQDHAALLWAAKRGVPVIPVFVWARPDGSAIAPGSASRWWLHGSLTSLGQSLAKRGSRLIVRCGDPAAELASLARSSGADCVVTLGGTVPAESALERHVEAVLHQEGRRLERLAMPLLFDPDCIRTGQGRPYQVFTAFWRACLAHGDPRLPLPDAGMLQAPVEWPAGLNVDALPLLPRVDWAGGMRRTWEPGETGAHDALKRFLATASAHYAHAREFPALEGTSRLSPHLHFGEVSPHAVWACARQAALRANGKWTPESDPYLRQVMWREFAHHLLLHFPHTCTAPLRPQFNHFPWRHAPAELRAWQRGLTGYPIVDAGMRQLWKTGWMHNRVRMIAGSFLVKDLLLSWQEGAAWFRDTLVDADEANNTLGWQWVSGCGADAAPYFRVFNPVLQGERFDAEGAYVRRYLPELARVPNAWIHQPWRADRATLRAAGVELGATYPEPIVSHAAARIRALAALRRMTTTRGANAP